MAKIVMKYNCAKSELRKDIHTNYVLMPRSPGIRENIFLIQIFTCISFCFAVASGF